MKLITHFHLVATSRMVRAIPSLPQYAFMAWCSVKSQGHFYPYPTDCRVPSSSSPLLIAVKLKAKENFRTAAMFLFYNIQTLP
jgi:hypothetical protein